MLAGWNRPPEECCVHWAPDGQYFVFQSTRNGVTNVWAMREKGVTFARRIGSQSC
ncbi:MAG: hypothetical protein DMG57_33125 [Acidobacteria bacterium]|nr:MAG: hypothetical protein DMG57_33125 [Acidobacteriota bacterium]